MRSPDIRAGMALVMAALCADGECIVQNAQIVDRGYEGIEQKLRSLGADIVREMHASGELQAKLDRENAAAS